MGTCGLHLVLILKILTNTRRCKVRQHRTLARSLAPLEKDGSDGLGQEVEEGGGNREG